MIPPSLQKRPYIIVSNRSIASGIFELRLKPENEVDCVPMPEAGQWLYLELPDHAGQASGLRRAYSVASAPYEIEASHGELLFAIKVAGDISGKLESCQNGNRLWLQGPFGRFVMSNDDRPIVLIAGGIGVSPLRSMMMESIHRYPERPLAFIVSAKKSDELPYHVEFQSLETAHANLSYRPTCTREEGEEWKGDRGRVTKERLEHLNSEFPDADWCLCGPTSLMEDFSTMLQEIGVDPKRIHSEKFG